MAGPSLHFTHQVMCPGTGLGPSRGRGAPGVGELPQGWALCSLSKYEQTVLKTERGAGAEMTMTVTLGKSPSLSGAGLDCGLSPEHIPLVPSPCLSRPRDPILPEANYTYPTIPQISPVPDPVPRRKSPKDREGHVTQFLFGLGPVFQY